jgi:type VI secretion system protein ImpM
VGYSGDMKSHFTWQSAAATTAGNVRTHNEDSLLELPSVGLWAVADGMGGHNAGDIASHMVIESLMGICRRERSSALVDEVEDRLHEVNAHLHEAAGGKGLSGTTVAVLLALERHVLSLWAGDSRVYRSRKGHLAQLTRDHSYTQEMLDSGVVSPPPSNVITRAVGGTEELFLDIELSEVLDSDQYLLCTDGLYKELSEEELTQHMALRDPTAACEALMGSALEGICDDNVSVIVVKFVQS